jgi:hypothetical protein
MSRHESDNDDLAPFSPNAIIMSPTFSIADSDEEGEEQRRVAEEMELDENGRPISLTISHGQVCLL